MWPELTVGNQVMENDGCKAAKKSGLSPLPFSVLQRDELRPYIGSAPLRTHRDHEGTGKGPRSLAF